MQDEITVEHSRYHDGDYLQYMDCKNVSAVHTLHLHFVWSTPVP